MSLQTVLETALFQRVITPEMKMTITSYQGSTDLCEQEINCLTLLRSQIESGDIYVMTL